MYAKIGVLKTNPKNANANTVFSMNTMRKT